MKWYRFSRRMLLQGAGGATLAIPLLPSLLPSSAQAQSVSPVRYVHINSSHCLPRAHTYPAYFTPDAVAWEQRDEYVRAQSLQAIVQANGKLSEFLVENWNPFLSKVNVLTNAHSYIADERHSSSTSSCCSAGGEGGSRYGGPKTGYSYSVDHLVEQAFSTVLPSPIPALRVHLWQQNPNDGYTGHCYRTTDGKTERIPMMHTIEELGAALSGFDGSDPTEETRTQNRLLIDSVLEDYNTLQNHRRISSLDRQRLGDSADLWRDIQRLSSIELDCGTQSLNGEGLNWGERHRLAMDSVVAALACGLTRNVAYGLVQGGDDLFSNDTMHAWEHEARVEYHDLARWRGALVTHMLEKLDGLLDATGESLLDGSLVAWGHEYGNWAHSMLGHTLVMAGNAGGRIETGLHIDLGGTPINSFHYTNMLALGLSQEQIEVTGRPGFGEYTDQQIRDDGVFQPLDTPRNEIDIYDNEREREYNNELSGYFLQDSQKRKPLFYLKT